MYRFTARNIGNRPKLVIEGHSIEHVLSSPYFTVVFDMYDVVCDEERGAVKIIAKKELDPSHHGMLIGWMEQVTGD